MRPVVNGGGNQSNSKSLGTFSHAQEGIQTQEWETADSGNA